MNEEKAERLIELCKKVRAGAPPRPHDDRTREHYEQCVPCREWERARDASFQKIETEEGMIPGGLMAIRFLAMATKVEALMEPRSAGHGHSSREEIKQCPECQKQDKARAAAWERVSRTPPEEMVKEIGVGLEWVANAKAAMLPVIDASKNAVESGDLPHPPEHMRTHKSQQEMLACDICNAWLRRRDAIVKDALPPPHNLRGT
jgi:hypothetical protein